MKERIKVTGKLTIKCGDEIIYQSPNTIITGLSNTAKALTHINQFNDFSGDAEVAENMGRMPIFIVTRNSAGSSAWWMPIMEFSRSGGTVTYKALAQTTEGNFAFRYIYLGTYNFFDRFTLIYSAGHKYFLDQGPTPTHVNNTQIVGQPALFAAYCTIGGNTYWRILEQETGFISGLTYDSTYRIYDDATDWCIETGSDVTIPDAANAFVYVVGNAAIARTYTTEMETTWQFAKIDLGSDAITKSSSKEFMFIWEITYS